MSGLRLEKVEGNKYHFTRDPEAVSGNGNRYLPDAFKDALMDNMKFSSALRGPRPWMDEEPRRRRGRPKKYKISFDKLVFPIVRRGRHNYRDELGQFKKAPSLREIMMSTDLRTPVPDLFTQAYLMNIPGAPPHDVLYANNAPDPKYPIPEYFKKGDRSNVVIVDEVAEYEANKSRVERHKAAKIGEPWQVLHGVI